MKAAFPCVGMVKTRYGTPLQMSLCFNAMLKKIFRSNVCAIGPKYGIIKAKLDKLLLVFQFDESRISQQRRQIHLATLAIAETAQQHVFA